MKNISAKIVIVAMTIAVSYAGSLVCNTDPECDGEHLKCIAVTPARKMCGYCYCRETDQCRLTVGKGDANKDENANNDAKDNGKGDANAQQNANDNAIEKENGNTNDNGITMPTATCECDENSVQPYCEPTCAFTPHPCGVNTVCNDNNGTAAANCTCEAGYVGNPIDGCVATCAVTPHPCGANTVCDDNGGTAAFTCTCETGYEGNPIDGCIASVQSCEPDPYSAVCGGHLTDESGNLQYPYPPSTTYNNDEQCYWTITTTPGKSLTITFDYFVLESCCDYLTIFDCDNGNTTHLVSLNGDVLPSDVVSTQNQLFLLFTTDYSIVYDGFELNWTSA